MFYGDWANICLATSVDGQSFTRHKSPAGGAHVFFGASPADNTRDPMVLRVGEKWHCYYTAYPARRGAVYVRTSNDLLHWSDARMAAAGGEAGDGPFSAECPFVVEPAAGEFYLFRTQQYGAGATTRVYYSRDPLDFGMNSDAKHLVTTLPIAAPEIIRDSGKWFVAALLPTLKGIQLAELEWLAVR